ncbi:hypothetical protein MKK67_00150 [Methylobacterium sp. J-072]|uniref:hypothetical protein n=1 Tax=Methylobacterium sp. J-072 TaxID=2836651 RepID=UPI001FBBD77F|nr:hypothetical protein [Methylobacterium sp. J-072]MCJ2090926.1 hypothetical protein [Methylobacterium sp. J-072]
MLMARIEGDLLNAASEVWTDRRNVQAAIVFALSGGGPAILRRLTRKGSPDLPDTNLARGALAYIDGQEAEASRLLKDVDTAPLPTTLAGSIGLTQAALTVTENPVRAIALLDRVRLSMPGTLVEEGALRREIFTLGQGGDLKKFEVLAIQYLRRFQHSIYAGNFRQRFAYQLTQLDFGRDETRFAAFSGAEARAPDPVRAGSAARRRRGVRWGGRAAGGDRTRPGPCRVGRRTGRSGRRRRTRGGFFRCGGAA